MCLFSLTELWVNFLTDSVSFLPVHPKGSFAHRQGVLHNGLYLPFTLLEAEVYVSGGAGVADDLAGAHHALLPHTAGRRSPLPGLLRCGVSGGAQDPGLHPPRLQGDQ